MTENTPQPPVPSAPPADAVVAAAPEAVAAAPEAAAEAAPAVAAQPVPEEVTSDAATVTGEPAAVEEPVAPAREVTTAPGGATGRRKEAIARVRLSPGTGQWTVNGRPLDVYFPNKVHQQLVNEPFKVLDLDGRYDVIARIEGGGVSGQAGALRLGIARALNAIDLEGNRPELKKAGFLSRDARVKERRKAGLKKARKAPQYSKR